jgi:hypothetical protein
MATHSGIHALPRIVCLRTKRAAETAVSATVGGQPFCQPDFGFKADLLEQRDKRSAHRAD